MYFIALLLALTSLQYLGSASLLQRDQWFYALLKAIGQYFPDHKTVTGLIAVLSSVLLVGLGLYFVGSWLWGSVELGISVVVLLYAFGRGEFNETFESYIEAWREGKLNELQNIIAVSDAGYEYVAEDNLSQIHVAARDSFLYAGFQRLFVVLFWFALLGPVGALLYRLLDVAADAMNDETLHKIKQYIEWPAARLLALSFVIVGDFSTGLSACTSSILHPSMSNKQVISAAGLASSGLDMTWLSAKFYELHDNKSLAIKAGQEIKVIKQLLTRSLALAVVGFALFQVF